MGQFQEVSTSDPEKQSEGRNKRRGHSILDEEVTEYGETHF